MAINYTKHDQGAGIWIGLTTPVTTTNSGGNYTTITTQVYLQHYSITYGNTWWVNGILKNASGTQIGSTVKLDGIRISQSSNTKTETYIGDLTFTGTFAPGTYSIEISFQDSSGQYTYSGYTVKGHLKRVENNIVLATLVTACGAPAHVYVGGGTATSTTIVPSTVTVNWTAGTAGTENAITKYRIYYNIGSAPTTSSTYIETSNTTTSYSFTSASSRGSTYYFKVMTIGTVSGYNSGLSSTQATCVVNQLPNAPTLNKASQTIASGVSTFSIKATAGAANAGFSGQRVFYNNKNSHTGHKEVTSGTAFSIGGSGQHSLPSAGVSTTYYFWTYDGSEYSSATTITITKNTKPAFQSVTFTPTSYLAQNTAKNENKYVSSVTVSATCAKSCTINIRLLYGSTETSINTALNQPDKAGSTSNVSLGTYNINQLLKSYYTGNRLWFKLSIRPTDSYEEGDWVESDPWSIAAKPTLQATYDRFSTTNLVDNSHCWDKIRIVYYEDASMTSRSVTATSNGSATTASFSTSTSGNYRYLDVTLSQTLPSNATIVLTVTLTDGNITKTFTATRTELLLPDLGTFGMNLSTINMYTTTSNIQLTCTSPCAFNGGNTTPVSTGQYKINSITVKVAANANGSGSRSVTISNIAQTSEGQPLSIPITKGNFTQFGDFGKTTYSGTATGYVQVIFTNLYGRSISTGVKSYTLNYNEQATVGALSMVYGANDTAFNTSSHKLQEGLSIKLKTTSTAYTAGSLTTKFYYRIGSSGTWTLFNSQTSTVANNANVKTINITSNAFVIPAITADTAWQWKAEVYSISSTAATTSAISTNVIKHITPVLTFTMQSPSYVRSGTTTTFKIKSITVSNNGTNVTPDSGYPQFFVCDTTNTAITSTFTGTSNVDINYNATDKWQQKTIKIGCTVKVTGLAGTKTKTGYSSNVITVYTDQPTVAYRTNRLGINTDEPASDAVLDVRGTTGKEIIRLGDPSNYHIEISLVPTNLYIDII